MLHLTYYAMGSETVKGYSLTATGPWLGAVMHVAILGAGALGTLVGARAWLGGCSRVTLVARPAHRDVIERRGIRLRGQSGGEVVARGEGLTAVAHPSLVEGEVDYLVVTVKRTDTQSALAGADPVRERVRCALSLQNGIDQDEPLAAAFGRGTVLGGMTMEGAAMPEPGVIDHLLASTTYLGELDGKVTARVEALAEVLGNGGLATKVVEDIGAGRWTKFVQSCAASGLCGVTRLGYAPATATDAGARLYVALIREGVAVMRERGMDPSAWFSDAAPVREVADLATEDAVAMIRTLAVALIEGGYVGSTSLARDLERGRRSEADALMGEMVRAGAELGIPTPTMRTVYLAIKTVDDTRDIVPGMPAGRAAHTATT